MESKRLTAEGIDKWLGYVLGVDLLEVVGAINADCGTLEEGEWGGDRTSIVGRPVGEAALNCARSG